MNYRTMKVEGHEVSDAVQRLVVPAFVEKIRAEGAQDFKAMKQLLIEQGTPADPAYRAADRLIQKMRKAQVIEWCPGLGWIIGDASK
jgi:hypothetical protein